MFALLITFIRNLSHFCTGKSKWRPKLLFIKEDLFIFEDVSQLGYKMPHYRDTMPVDEMKATVKALARFHAASYIHEERNSNKLGRPYRIWEDYKEYLQEPVQREWRDTGRKAAKDFLKVFSKYKSLPDFEQKLDTTIRKLFNGAWFLMQPSTEYRNVVVHRDLWTNNIFIRHQDNGPHILFVDFQTVLYASPMLDLTSLLYFNTTKADRKKFGDEFINIYYDALRSNLDEYDIDINNIFSKDVLLKSYKESVVFGMTQASLIVPITAMDSKTKEEIFCNPDRCVKANVESRSEEFIETAQQDIDYRNRVIDLLDDIVETFVLNDSY